MKRYLLLLVLFSFTCSVNGQQITFQKRYNSIPNATLPRHYELIQTEDKGYLAGNSELLLKVDSLGHKQSLVHIIPGIFSENFFSIAKLQNSDFVTTGSSILLKSDDSLNISWVKDLTGISSVLFYTVRETTDKGFILGAHIDYVSIPDVRFLLIKTDSSGIVQWSKVYDMPNGDSFTFLTLTPDGGFMLCGYSSYIYPGYMDICVLKVDSLGNSQWAKHYASSNINNSNSFAYHITTTSDGNYVLAVSRYPHRILLKIDTIGNILWEKYYAAELNGTALWLEETKDKGLITVGDLEGNDSGFVQRTCILMKTDSIGNLEWVRELGGYAEVWAGCVKQTEDGGYVIGARRPGPQNSQTFTIIKTDSLGHTNGCLEGIPLVTVTNIIDSVISVPVTDSAINVVSVPITLTSTQIGSVFNFCTPVGIDEIQQDDREEIEIYPNPFTERFKVSGLKFKIGEHASIVIYDLMGATVYQQELSSNKTSAELNLSFLEQGVYFLNVKSNGESWTRKIVKM